MKAPRHSVLLAAALVALTSPCHAIIVAYTGAGANAGGGAGNLNIGRQFSVTGSGITIFDLGVWDSGGNGLVNPHTVSLFTINSGAGAANANTALFGSATVNVPAGTAAPLDSGFRFAPLATPTFLAPGNYSVVAFGTNVTGGDPYGDGGGFPTGGNVSDIRFDPYQFTSATPPPYPNGGDTGNHSSASFRYELGNVTVPEPSIAVLALFGAAALGGGRRRRPRA